MYDPTNAANVAALKSELQTNPTALTGPGNVPLQTLAANGQDQDCANVLNKVRATITIQRDDVTPLEVLAVAYVVIAYGVGLRFYVPDLTRPGSLVRHARTLVLLAVVPVGLLLLLVMLALHRERAFAAVRR